MSSWKKIIWLIILLVLMVIVAPVIAQTEESTAVARVIVFHSPTCPHCRTVIQNTLTPLETQYENQLEIRYYDLSQINDYQVFRALRESYPDLLGGVPQILIGNVILVGSVDIPQQLPNLIESCLAQGGCDWAFTVEALEAIETGAEQHHTVYLAYVYDATCLECDAVTYDLNYLETMYPYLYVQTYDVEDDAATIDAMGELFAVSGEERLIAPAIFIGDQYFGPDDIDVAVLQTLIESESLQERLAPWESISDTDIVEAEQRISERFSQFSLLAIAVAGLLDGLNPCAFTTIIFSFRI